MTVVELKAKWDAGEKPVVLDVREADELARAAYPFPVVHVPMGELPARIGELPRDGVIVCACRSGGRSASVGLMSATMRFTGSAPSSWRPFS